MSSQQHSSDSEDTGDATCLATAGRTDKEERRCEPEYSLAEGEKEDPEVQSPLIDLEPANADSEFQPATVHHPNYAPSQGQSIPVLRELESEDSTNESSSSTDVEGDALIPDLDALTTATDTPSSSGHKRARPTNDPQVLQRRERNRKAASQCRKRQNQRTEELDAEVNDLKKKEQKYLRDIRIRKEELSRLKAEFRAHLPQCPMIARHRALVQARRHRTGLAMRQNSGPFVPAS